MMKLIEYYEQAVNKGDITNDPHQRLLLTSFQRVGDELNARKKSWFNRPSKVFIQGIYLYGSVGIGKTYLMDLFFNNIPEKQKKRFHFHHFMQEIDIQLRNLQGKKDPLRLIAANLAKSTRLLCLDEFMVHDIADAMILAELLQTLFSHNVVIVATSNIPPDELYLNGLQRARFLPAIALIKAHCQLITQTDHCDYRRGRQPQLKAYLYPLDTATQLRLSNQFDELGGCALENNEIDIQNRFIPCVKCSKRAVWFEFNVICNLPRSQLDYLEIAQRFDTVFVSDVPQLDASKSVSVLLLKHFIDVMYDQGIRLILSAAVPLDLLYRDKSTGTSFERTLSRLEEMQSDDYLQRHVRRSDKYNKN